MPLNCHKDIATREQSKDPLITDQQTTKKEWGQTTNNPIIAIKKKKLPSRLVKIA